MFVNKFYFYLNNFGLDFLTFAIKIMMQLLRIPAPSLLSLLLNAFHAIDCKNLFVTDHCPKDKIPKSLTRPMRPGMSKPRLFLNLIHCNPAMLNSSQFCKHASFFPVQSPPSHHNLCWTPVLTLQLVAFYSSSGFELREACSKCRESPLILSRSPCFYSS